MSITAKLAREIIKFAGSKGKGAAVKKYGDDAVKDAKKQMQRDAREAYKKKERAKKKNKGASATKKTPTGTRKARKVSPKTPKLNSVKIFKKLCVNVLKMQKQWSWVHVNEARLLRKKA